jgi:folate-binding protein YgfZ
MHFSMGPVCQNRALPTTETAYKTTTNFASMPESSVQSGQWQRVDLAELAALRIRGQDAVRFLQGQLSNDVEQLQSTRSLLAGYHSPQGRTIAVLRLVQLAPLDLIAILPRELASSVAGKLAKYILRSKVNITDESGRLRLHGLISPEGAEPSPGYPTDVDAVARLEDSRTLVRIAGEPARWLAISLSDVQESGPQGIAVAPEVWWRLDIAAGLPQVLAGTSEAFVAQMLNLDALGAIAFDKGCYTGQEVIARAHYRGRVKRRLQRFVSHGPIALSPGESRQLADGRRITVVNAATLPDGRCAFLAVAPLTADAEAHEAGAEVLAADSLPLPYSLPE